MPFLAVLIFLQMLPATLVAPAVRPLFAVLHGGQEGAMHAFMSLNMVGAVVAAGLLGRRPRRFPAGTLVAALALLDALLLVLVASPIPTALALAARCLEGATHVGAATVLVAAAAARPRGSMAVAGAAIMLAVALGSLLGGVLVAHGASVPFWAGAALLVGVAGAAWGRELAPTLPFPRESRREGERAPRWVPGLGIPLAAAFVGRFAVGAIIVTFALYCRNVHGLADRTVGVLYTCLTLPFAFAMYPVGRVSERIPRALVLAGGAALFAGVLAGLAVVPVAALGPLMAVGGVASAMIFAPTLAYAADLAGPGLRTRAMALVNGAGCLGMLLGPALGGATSALLRSPDDLARGYRGAFFLAAGAVAVWLVLALPWLWRRAGLERAHFSVMPV